VAEAPSKRSTSRLAGISLLACLLSGCGLVVRQATIAYFAVDAHFSPKAIKIEIDKSFIEQYKNRVTIRTVFTVDKAMGGPLPGALDGDLHFAGRAPQVALPLVAEIANASDQKAGAELVHRAEGTGKPLRISGVWRVWPEHAGSAEEVQGTPLSAFDTYKPDHVFEIHPITAINSFELLDSFTPVRGFSPGGAQRVFGILGKVACGLTILPKTVSIITETGLCNDVEFIMRISSDPQVVVSDGRFVTAAALDLDGNVLVERLRTVFVKGTPPERAVRLLKSGDCVHIYGIPRLDFQQISLRANNPTIAELPHPLPYEIVVLGVYPKN